MPFYAQQIETACTHLRKCDPVMKRLLKAVGPFTARTKRDRFGTLIGSIISQQISVAAARTIRGRLADAVQPERISPNAILEFSLDELRELGVSRQKATYILDLSEKVKAKVCCLDTIHRNDDEAVIQELILVKGIGRWTAQMFLMFSLGRLDVLPVDDLGIKNAMKLQYELDELPSGAQMTEIASTWRPYATIACWYLWQSLELE